MEFVLDVLVLVHFVHVKILIVQSCALTCVMEIPQKVLAALLATPVLHVLAHQFVVAVRVQALEAQALALALEAQALALVALVLEVLALVQEILALALALDQVVQQRIHLQGVPLLSLQVVHPQEVILIVSMPVGILKLRVTMAALLGTTVVREVAWMLLMHVSRDAALPVKDRRNVLRTMFT